MEKSTLTRGHLLKVVLEMPQYEDKRKRTIRIWLPDGYDQKDKTTKYPVFYMQDGQNLFDKATSFSGEWEIDESIGSMMDQGYLGSIVVGIDNGESERLNEYSPQAFKIKKEKNSYNIVGSGEKYAAFIVETLKPYIDTNFNTLKDKANTGIGGSSMGGIISFYTALNYQDIFGYALLFSSSFWLYEDNTIALFLKEKIKNPSATPRMYIYHGSVEGNGEYLKTFPTLLAKNLVPVGSYTTYIGVGRQHNEHSWAAEFPRAYKWLFNRR